VSFCGIKLVIPFLAEVTAVQSTIEAWVRKHPDWLAKLGLDPEDLCSALTDLKNQHIRQHASKAAGLLIQWERYVREVLEKSRAILVTQEQFENLKNGVQQISPDGQLLRIA
jgi:hypothetical protein